MAFLKRRGQLHSITADNGTEFSAYRSIERSLGEPVYFAHPYRSTDKPHIERANALIRQYLPKHSSFVGLIAKKIKEIESGVSITAPRKKLGYRTPHEIFNHLVYSVLCDYILFVLIYQFFVCYLQ